MPEQLQEQLNGILNAAVERGDIPGVVGTVAGPDELHYAHATGKRALGGDDAMMLDSVFWVASMSKSITAIAAMQLVEQGLIDLDAPAEQYLPELADVQVLESFDSNGQPRLRTPASQLTLRQLLTHTSGFAYEIWHEGIGKYQQATGAPGILSAQKQALKMPLVFDPGTGFEYGIGIAWVGQIVEAVSGQRLGEYLHKSLFEPLAMQDTAFKISPDMRRRLVSVHARSEDGSLSLFPFETPQDPEVQLGGEALYSTAPDYQRLMRMLLNGGKLDGERVLQADTVALMSKNHMGDLDYMPLKTAMPALSRDTNFYPGMQQKWGLSFLINTQDSPEGRPAGSLSWAGLSNCYYWIDPKTQISGAIYTQILPFFDPKAVALFREFESTVYKNLP